MQRSQITNERNPRRGKAYLNQAESNRNGRGDWELGLLNVDDLSQGKTQVKILILYPSEHAKIRTPEDQKTIAITSSANYKQITSRDTFAFSNTSLAAT